MDHRHPQQRPPCLGFSHDLLDGPFGHPRVVLQRHTGDWPVRPLRIGAHGADEAADAAHIRPSRRQSDDLGANVEIKPHPGTAVETAEEVCRILAAHWPDSLPAPLISSFAPEALETAYRVAPDFARGILTSRIKAGWRDQVEAIKAATINCDHTHLSAARAREVRAAGYPLLAYTVNHAGRAEELFGWGVSAVFSDVPDETARVA